VSKELFSTRLVQIVLRWKFLSKVVIHDITEDPKETILTGKRQIVFASLVKIKFSLR